MTLTMSEAKALGLKASGQEFACDSGPFRGNVPNGVIGVVLPTLSARGKLQAELTCTEPGCTNTHIRECSDWHQCTKCEVHRKHKGKKSGNATGLDTGGMRSVKLEDGTILREMKVLDTDDEELRELKVANNEIFAKLYQQEQERRELAAMEAKEARAAQAEEARLAREAKAAEAKKEAARAALERARQYVQANGGQISQKLIDDAS